MNRLIVMAAATVILIWVLISILIGSMFNIIEKQGLKTTVDKIWYGPEGESHD